MAAPVYEIITLPKLTCVEPSDNQSHELARKYRNFRLESLKTAPEAFAATYEVESQRDLTYTLQRLSNPKAAHFVALSKQEGVVGEQSAQDLQQRLLETEWVGTIVLLGPEEGQSSPVVSASADPFSNITASAVPDELRQGDDHDTESPKLHYHLNGIFVSSSARNHGLGKGLIEAALAKAAAQAQMLNTCVQSTILVDSENVAARRLYEKAGFVVVGQESYVQQPRALVSGELRSSERTALLLEWSNM